MSYFAEAYTGSKNKMKVELDLSNYATKFDLKNAASIDTSDFAVLFNLKSKIDKLDIDKLETTPVVSSKLSDVIKNEVIKKDVYDLLIKTFNAIQTADTSN